MSTTTLLLNASYEPMRFIDSDRAVVMVLLGKAEIIEEGDGVYHSPSTSVPVPLVVRLTRYVQVPFRSRIPLSNSGVLRRDRHECCYCDKRRGTTVDHVHPRALGGQHVWENVVAACQPCNSKKADKTLADLGWKMRFQPTVPTGKMWLLMGIKANDAWEPYLNPAVA